jgi:ribonuclease Z
MQLTITGYSTALFATWYFVDELGLLFDAGDGLTSALLQKSRKVRHAFISHADRDHLTGLFQFNQLNAREGGLPIIYYPKDSGSFPAIAEFANRFDPHVTQVSWHPMAAGDEARIKDDMVVESIRNGHVEAPVGVTKSLSYKVVQVKRKLRPEFTGLQGLEIKKLKEEKGEAAVTTEVRTTLLGYSGDTPVEDLQRWNNTEVLIHEATFLGGAEDARAERPAHKHSTLREVMEMVSTLNIGKLILGHFSVRYDAGQIDQEIKGLCEKYAINIPVYRLLPGETVHDILHQQPLNG